MTGKELEKLLKREAEEHTPELADVIMQKAEEEGLFQKPQEVPAQEEIPVLVFPKRNRGLRGLVGTFVAVAACCAITMPFVFREMGSSTVVAEHHTSVCMQINPSVEFTVKNGKVTKARALNQDGAVLLVHSQLVGKSVEAACLDVAGMAERRNLLTADGITLYVSGGNEAATEKLIVDELSAHNYLVNSEGKDTQSEVERLKATYPISKGKAKLVAEVLRLYPDRAEKRTVTMSSEELHELIEDYHEEEMERFEASLWTEYETQYAGFVEKVSKLLTTYRDDLTALNELTAEARGEAIVEFNQTYAALGEDFLIEVDESWRETYNECLEELDEVEEELAENADDAFADLFEDWLEEFQEGRFDRDD